SDLQAQAAPAGLRGALAARHAPPSGSVIAMLPSGCPPPFPPQPARAARRTTTAAFTRPNLPRIFRNWTGLVTNQSVIQKNDLDRVVLGATAGRLVVEVGLVAPQAAGHEPPGLDPARGQGRVDRLGPGRRDGQQLRRLAAIVGVADDLNRVGRVLLHQ